MFPYWLKHMKILPSPFNTACCQTYLAAAHDNSVLLHAAFPQTTLGKQEKQIQVDKSFTAAT